MQSNPPPKSKKFNCPLIVVGDRVRIEYTFKRPERDGGGIVKIGASVPKTLKEKLTDKAQPDDLDQRLQEKMIKVLEDCLKDVKSK